MSTLTKVIIAYMPHRSEWTVVCVYDDGDKRAVSSKSLQPALDAAGVLAEQLGANPLLEIRGPVQTVLEALYGGPSNPEIALAKVA